MERIMTFFKPKKPEDPKLKEARDRLERLERLEILEKRRELMRREYDNHT